MMMGEKKPPNVNLFVFIVSDFIIFEKSLIFLKFGTIFIQYEKKMFVMCFLSFGIMFT